ncbi:unnamed protein product [Zymoseptoria tritici ST99CH_3D1]|nr:unnamed protein product [Zymoseptoria tritici ST99CH_3D1]
MTFCSWRGEESRVVDALRFGSESRCRPHQIADDCEDKGTCAKVGDDLKAQDAKLTEQIKELAKKPAKDSTPATATAADVAQPDTPVEQTSTPHQDGMKKVPSQESY